MNQLTLRQLRYFEALAHHGHFGRAAEASFVSQPALSMQIRELEETLGVTLVERGSRTVRLTPVGEETAARARDILRAVDELGDMARNAAGGLAGRLRIGVIPTVAPYLLPSVITTLSRMYPALDIKIRETITPTLISALKEGRIDMAIVALPTSEPTLTEMELFSEAFMLVRPKAQANAPVPRAEDLPAMRLLLLEEGHCFRDQALSFCALGGTTTRDMLDASSLSTLVQMVSSGIGVTLIPEMAVSVETRSADVAISRLADPQPGRSIGMVWRKANPLGPTLKDIATALKRP
ncbi:LysR family hydrogen peroxide-inducible transcriptional activator [Rubricella aquisinus]|uniref:LysR family hydrogen peroxide-inducible transcriptional activator n=1 Tax=Rubricella aquisinus TaxID=2028108 RepID=A0A840X651_9RHOB|nr:hydrogen peroxide-inducible genes activator [Rubricella aquisinus]MBB5516187.1 LysR family hydrogen peroxide-inducible transcriptional activator [Rubricella aquisinus]